MPKIRTIQMSELPSCDICKQQGVEKQAEYDSKTVLGPHAYLCPEHFRSHGRPPSTRLEKRVKIAAAKTDKVPVVQISIEQSLESPVYIKCPHCGEERAVEPDANYVVTCDSCDNKYRVVSAI